MLDVQVAGNVFSLIINLANKQVFYSCCTTKMLSGLIFVLPAPDIDSYKGPQGRTFPVPM